MRNAYAFTRPVANAYLVRERDRKRLRELALVLVAVGTLGIGLLSYTWIHLEVLSTGYKIDKLEKQLHKLHDKWIDSKRHGVGINGKKAPIPEVAVPAPPAKKKKALKPTRVQRTSKPISIEEAPIAIKPASTYLVFEELGSGQIHVLVRRADNEFDLIEAR